MWGGLGCFLGLCVCGFRSHNRQALGTHLSGQFFILSTEALTRLVKAGLGASDGLFEEVDGEADSGLGRSSGGKHYLEVGLIYLMFSTVLTKLQRIGEQKLQAYGHKGS